MSGNAIEALTRSKEERKRASEWVLAALKLPARFYDALQSTDTAQKS